MLVPRNANVTTSHELLRGCLHASSSRVLLLWACKQASRARQVNIRTGGEGMYLVMYIVSASPEEARSSCC